MTLVYPAPGDRPLIAFVDVPGVPPGWRTITCWCRTVKVCYGAENANRVADQHYCEHRAAHWWTRLLERWTREAQ